MCLLLSIIIYSSIQTPYGGLIAPDKADSGPGL